MDSVCECCKTIFKLDNPIQKSWRQYCKACFTYKGNDEYDIVVAGVNSKGYNYYKCIPKLSKYAFIDD